MPGRPWCFQGWWHIGGGGQMEIDSVAMWRRMSSWILIVAVIGAGDDVTEAGVFCCVLEHQVPGIGPGGRLG